MFNGDFHYLDVDPDRFATIEAGVHAHHATLGNVEYALSSTDDTLGCGCDYPAYVADDVVANSNLVLDQLRDTAPLTDAGRARLAALPRHLTVDVGGRRVGIVHGDPESLAGWRLALEALDPPNGRARTETGFNGETTSSQTVLDWCRRAEVTALCCTHTGLPHAQDHDEGDDRGGRRRLVVNNGCAGLPNYAGQRFGVMTRLSADPHPPADSLYGLTLDGLRFDAIPVRYNHDRWRADFLHAWPPGSPGHINYAARIEGGTRLSIAGSVRGSIRLGPALGPTT